MARTTILQKIINAAIDKGANEVDLLFIKRLYEISPFGVINNYADFQNEIKQTIFAGNNSDYLKSAEFLAANEFIKFSKYDENLLLIPACEEKHLIKIKYKESRKYWSNPYEKLDRFLNSIGKRTRSLLTPSINQIKREGSMERIQVNWDKLLGIKIPRRYYSILAGMDDKFKYSREKVRYILGIISQIDYDGEIKDFTYSYIEKQLGELFEKNENGKHTINEFTIKDVHRKLLKDGVIEQREVLGKTIVKLVGYNEAFNDGYVVIPYCVFRGAFKQMRTAAYKIFFEVIFKWNNGENPARDGKFVIDPDKPIKFKLCLTGKETREEKEAYYEKVNLVYRKRCASEITDLFYGDNGFTGLEQIFSIDYTSFDKDGCIYLRLRNEYRVLKRDIRNEKWSYNYLNRYKQKAQIIKKILEKYKLMHTQQDLKDFVQVLKKERARVIDKLIKQLIQDIDNRTKNNLKPIGSLGAYINSMHKNFSAGAAL